MLYRVKTLLGFTDTSKDELLSNIIESLSRKALKYTNRPEVDEDLEDVIVDMTVSLYKSHYASQFGTGSTAHTTAITGGVIKSKSIGDVKIEYDTSSATSSSSTTSATQQVMDDYREQLNILRRPKFV